jgi:hypothetical protein
VNKPSFPLKFLDIFIIFISLGTIALSVLIVYTKPHKTALVSIRGERNMWVFPLDAEETVSVRGPLGDTVIEIHAGKVRAVSSPCASQTCVAQGHIHGAGQWIACLPNNVLAVIESGGEVFDANTW